jgi:hypothetical protein
MTVCLYQPDATVGFMFRRPEIENNDAHDAGGLEFRVIKPFEHHRVTYTGKVCVLKDPLEMAEPARAFKNNPLVQVHLELDYRATAPAWGGELRERHGDQWVSPHHDGDPDVQFAKGHFEQLGRATGSIKVDDREYKFDGLGLRDHSWGPRYWQAPKYYRWLTMNFDEGLGGMATVTVNRDGSEHPGGFIARKGQQTLNVHKVEIDTEFTGEQNLHDKIKAIILADGSDEPLIVTGKVISMIPLRNRRAGMVTRIAEGLTEWRWGEKVGYGLAEYLDHFEE